MFFRIIVLLSMSLCSINLFSQDRLVKILDTDKMEELMSHVDKDTLVVFDIDNTILSPAQELGTDQWFYYYWNKHIEAGIEKNEALAKVLSLWSRIQLNTEVEAIEKQTPSIIRELQNNDVKVIGLTTRHITLAYCTLGQLNALNINMKNNPLLTTNLSLDTDYPSNYIEGVLFSGGSHKGEALKTLFKRLGFEPKKIIFINDKEKYLHEVAAIVDEVDYIGIRYGAVDDKVESFNAEIADVQLHYFNKILSNEDARLALEAIKKTNQL